jgi:DNA-binding PadR family transcriptional regulator
VLTLAILGFLFEQPLHAYELRARIGGLTGQVRRTSDGALYPAINRLLAAGHLTRHQEAGASGIPRQVLTLTQAGRDELLRRLARPAQLEISDRAAFQALLAFLGLLADSRAQAAVLRRRLDYLDQPAPHLGEVRPDPEGGAGDPFREGLIQIALATREAERNWLRGMLDRLEAACA